MKYMGSKNRIAKYILPIMLKDRGNKTWVEPFVGGANMIDKVDGTRIGSDFNPYVIQALVSIRDFLNKIPKDNTEFTETMYKKLRDNNYRFKGYVGFTASYSGKWLGGWARNNTKSLKQRDYIAESYRNAVRQSPLLQSVRFIESGYDKLSIPNNSIIYCDPPYENTTKYKAGDFNHNSFWKWCRQKTKEGHTVFVSEYNAPPGFQCVWQKEIVSSLTKNTGSKRSIEKLFKCIYNKPTKRQS